MLQNVLIYGGIAINIAGALFLMAYAIKYAYAFYRSKNKPVETESLKPGWYKKRNIGFGLIIIGSVITIIGCAV